MSKLEIHVDRIECWEILTEAIVHLINPKNTPRAALSLAENAARRVIKIAERHKKEANEKARNDSARKGGKR